MHRNLLATSPLSHPTHQLASVSVAGGGGGGGLNEASQILRARSREASSPVKIEGNVTLPG